MEPRKLGGLIDDAGKPIAQVIKERGGGAGQVGKLQSGYGQLTLGEVARRAADGDPEAEKALKMVKQAGTQGKGGIRFERSSVVVTAVAEDDTISLAAGGPSLPFVHDLTATDPWSTIIGCGVLWLWRMTNHRGYLDGCQIEFGRPGECWGVQLMCEASSLSARSLGPIDHLWNQFA